MSARFVFPTMGTVVSLATRDQLPRATQDAVLAAFHEHDARFSLGRDDSEASRFSRRELRLNRASPAFRAVYDEAIRWRFVTAGAFTPRRPDGAVDLSGLVKALAIAAAAAELDARGHHDWCLNAGGDVLVGGRGPDGGAWHAGVVDPGDRRALLAGVDLSGRRRALATSGTAERGEHVWRLGADDRFRQVSVLAPDIVTADVWATAVLAGGLDALQRAAALPDVDVLACGASGEVWSTPAFRSAA